MSGVHTSFSYRLSPDLDSDSVPVIAVNTTGGLPDFLSDPAVNSVDARGGGSPALSDDFLYQANGDLELELRRVW